MHFIVKVFPEIIIKSPPVRKRFIKQLRDNLRHLLRPLVPGIDVSRDWEKVEVCADTHDPELTARVADLLGRTPGIGSYFLVHSHPLGDMDDILAKTLEYWGPALTGKSFCVRVKRSGEHAFRSVDVERYVGGGLLKHTRDTRVDLHNPEAEVKLEIKDRRLFVISRQYPGLGGYPLGTQDAVLSLVSGGFDSVVASYLMMKRGVRAHFCFFRLGGRAHEMAVKEVAYFLWQKFGTSHNVKFITVPFEEVVSEILEKVPNAYMGVMLKRLMLRAATRVAEDINAQALVTGESIAQVSSQTLPNLRAIDNATELPVLRPLIAMDKGDIIDLSRRIGTETFSASVPEYCGVISVRPTTKARPEKVAAAEEALDGETLERALAARQVLNIHELADSLAPEEAVPVQETPVSGQVVIDIRHPDEEALRPLRLEGVQVETIPFFRLTQRFAQLDSGAYYLLYCGRGVMSQLHAAHLRDAGHQNVGVFRPRED